MGKAADENQIDFFHVYSSSETVLLAIYVTCVFAN